MLNLKEKLREIGKNQFILNAAKLSSSNILLYLMPVVFTPILSRLYSVEAYGEWGTFSAFLSIIIVAQFLGYDNILMKVDRDKLHGSILLCVLASLCMIAFVVVLFVVGYFLKIPAFADFPSVGLLLVYLILYIGYLISYNLCNRFEHYSVLATTNVIQGLVQGLTRILMGVLAVVAVNGLILGAVFSELIAMVIYIVVIIKNQDLRGAAKSGWKEVTALAKRYKNFPLYDAPSGLLSFAAFNLPLLILTNFFEKGTIGCYSMILQLLLLPMSLIGGAVGKVYYQRICSQSDDPSYLTHVTSGIVRVMTLFATVPVFALCLGGDKLVVLFLGSQWQSAGDMAISLSLWSFAIILTQPLSSIYRFLDAQRRLIRYDILYFCVGIACIIAGCILHEDIRFILLTYSVTCLMVKIFLLFDIIRLAGVRKRVVCKALPLWALALVCLIIRVVLW